MKKILAIFLMALTSITITGCNRVELRFYNWGDYIDVDLVREFEKEYGIRVKTTYFSSNEDAVQKVKMGEQYDLMIPSEYAVEQMMMEGLLEKIDWSMVTSMAKSDLADCVLEMVDSLKTSTNGYDFLEYAVPYFFGNVGLLYNNTIAGIEDDIIASEWGVLTNSKYKVTLYDTSREGFLVALKELGYSMNSNNETQINEAKTWLLNLISSKKGSGKIELITDQVLYEMNESEHMKYDIVVAYSGDSMNLMLENEKLSFYIPTTKGTNVWVDGFVIPKGGNEELAYKFISFMMEKENAIRSTEYVGYSSPRQDVIDAVTADGELFADFKDIYNFEIQPKDEFYRHDSTTKALIDNAWLVIKAS